MMKLTMMLFKMTVINFAATEPKSNAIIKKCRRRLPTLAQTCDRHGVSDRAAAAIASAVLQDLARYVTPICRMSLTRIKFDVNV